MQQAAEAFAHFVAGFDGRRLTSAALAVFRRAYADTVACAVAARREPAAVRAAAYLAATGRLHPPVRADARATLWGLGRCAALEDAAFYNGLASHALDYDDVSPPMRGHPSVVLLPALVAVAQARRLPGAELAAAYAAGLEVIVRLSHAMARQHYADGWHATATLGVLGAAAGSARLLGLDAHATCHAIGLAVAQAGGVRESFGTDAKPFQAGHASACGLRAALLAAQGFTSSASALEGRNGFLHLFGSGEDLRPHLQGLHEGALEIESSGLDFKKYPMCYAAHRALDAVLDLRRAHALSADSVRAVQVRVARGGLDALLARLPANGLEGKFSLPYGIASALVDGAVTFPSFSADAFARTSVQQLMRRVEVAEDTGPAVPRWAEVIVRSIDGTERVARCEILRGSAQCPPSDDEVAAKVVDCFDHGGLGKEMAQHLLAFARDLGEAGGAAASDPNAPSAGWLDAFVPRR